MRRNFSVKVKKTTYEWSCVKDGKPHCTICDRIILGVPEYDHIVPDGLGGQAIRENCQILCGPCHRKKTHTHDRPIMAKADRQKKSAANIKPKRQIIPGSRASNFKRKLDGTTERRN